MSLTSSDKEKNEIIVSQTPTEKQNKLFNDFLQEQNIDISINKRLVHCSWNFIYKNNSYYFIYSICNIIKEEPIWFTSKNELVLFKTKFSLVNCKVLDLIYYKKFIEGNFEVKLLYNIQEVPSDVQELFIKSKGYKNIITSTDFFLHILNIIKKEKTSLYLIKKYLGSIFQGPYDKDIIFLELLKIIHKSLGIKTFVIELESPEILKFTDFSLLQKLELKSKIINFQNENNVLRFDYNT